MRFQKITFQSQCFVNTLVTSKVRICFRQFQHYHNQDYMRYKLLGKSGLRVSEVCLGTMTFGTEWNQGADFEESKKQFELFANAGGNFIDTANRYTEGTSERFIGEFLGADREQFVVATKYSLFERKGDLNAAGNHRKNMVQTLNASLKRLNMDYVDVLYLHMWDFTTPIEEVMRGLDDLVRAGKVLYVAISDTPAWIVSRANMLAELRGWSPFIGLQVEYSLIERAPERDLLPMAKELDLAITAWAPLAGGALTGKYLKNPNEAGRIAENSARRSERANAIAQEVVHVAEETGFSPTQVALRWLMARNQVVIPIVGARNAAQLADSLGVVDVQLSDAHLAHLDTISKIDLGFPHEFLHRPYVQDLVFGGLQDRLDHHRK
jgi:aryl-alcohol dehydrogenase-like predicted oxidoreductase